MVTEGLKRNLDVIICMFRITAPAYRAVLFRRLKGLEDIISIAISASSRKDEG